MNNVRFYKEMSCLRCVDIKCQVITPIINYGVNSIEPALREASLKGMLRYWWRAITTWDNTEDMFKYESRLFGDSQGIQGKSPLKIKIELEKVQKSNDDKFAYPLKPHDKQNPVKKNAFPPEQYFNVKFFINENLLNKDIISANDYEELIKNLMIATFILGGIGKRTRRGYGSSIIKEINGTKLNLHYNNIGDELVDYLNRICKIVHKREFYQKIDNQVIINTSGIATKYPTIQKIELGTRSYNNYDSLLQRISYKSHEIKRKYSNKYIVLGNINFNIKGKEYQRYGSPIYVSAYKLNDNLYPIITTLSMPENFIRKFPKNADAEKEFKGAIL